MPAALANSDWGQALEYLAAPALVSRNKSIQAYKKFQSFKFWTE